MLLQNVLTKCGGWHWIPISMCRVQEWVIRKTGPFTEDKCLLYFDAVLQHVMPFQHLSGKNLNVIFVTEAVQCIWFASIPLPITELQHYRELSKPLCCGFQWRNPPHIRNIKHQPEQTVQLHPHVKIKVISSLNIIWSILLCSVSGRRKDASSLCLSRLIEETITSYTYSRHRTERGSGIKMLSALEWN